MATDLDPDMKRKYQNYYSDGPSAWRTLCAIDKADNILSLCKGVPHGRVVEVGCGDGAILERLSNLGFADAYYALDISQSGIDAVRKRNIANLEECSVFDGYKIPFEDKSFDLAILSHVIEHVEHPRKLIYEAARIAKIVYIEVPLEDTAFLPWNYRKEDDTVGHINDFSSKTIRRLVQTCGLQVKSQIITNPSFKVHLFHARYWKALVKFIIRKSSLSLFPAVASRLLTYHGSLIASQEKVPPDG
jgi:SAM-dependent methyltransferase